MSSTLDKIKDTSQKIFRRILWILGIVIVVGTIGYFLWCNYTISEGSRSGTLFKISKVGIIFKTYEGQLHLSGSVMMTDQSTWYFSALDSKTFFELQQMEGKNIKCYYREKVNAMPWQGKTNYLVYKVQILE